MPTDPVLTLIAEMRAKADAMPEGRLSACGADRGGCKCATVWNTADDAVMLRAISTEPEQGLYDGYSEDAAVKHAAYFAALDPEFVRALLRLAEAMMRYPQGTSWADYDELVAAEDDLCRLAAERVTD